MNTAPHSDPALCQSPDIGAGPHSGHTAGVRVRDAAARTAPTRVTSAASSSKATPSRWP